MDAETKARFESLTKDVSEHSTRFDKIDTSLLIINKSLMAIEIKLASRESWNWLGKTLAVGIIGGLIGTVFYFIKSSLAG